MRDEYHPPQITTKLIITLIIAFVIQSMLLFYGDFSVHRHLALSVEGISSGKLWQFITFQFLHSVPWPWHVLFNCLGIYFFGRRVEEALGAKKFLCVYIFSGIAGGLLQVLLTVLLPRHADIPVVGASAGVCGLIAVYCSMHPMEELRTWIYFFPITVRARFFLIFLTCLSAYGALVPFDNVAHGAHLGGILLGLGYVRWKDFVDERFAGLSSKLSFRKSSNYIPGSRAKNSRRNPIRVRNEREAEEFISASVDPILDKISAQGIHSLTDRERKILEAARKKMEKQ